ncbi:TetR/AcrR family transcriptional regulator [Shewanella baltica]|uniref:Putative transcriptional regulator, TetR family n=1 Tax=Shewanella baltica (strain OS155 / ATCC BAA-1091) TaxID=325240 RepID=A3CZ80_SHEB5|nr:TetR/AcrR family transcriptional regulator [Shewanella baltica]ABN59793.1 putative transcriptional regulator, TetR family [Shewanella baltica OS155]AEH12159.1 regulatory protein TetR [Shewanella baltica OS117]
MSSWEQRSHYLIEVAQRSLIGHKTFDLCRSHLVAASQISKGTIYNHFTTEADLVVAVACAEYEEWLAAAKRDMQRYPDPLTRFLYHHCYRLHQMLSQQRYVIERVMPNQALLLQATDSYRQRFEKISTEYNHWNRLTISEIGDIPGFNRAELVKDYLRGAMINSDDANRQADDVQLYCQFSYALSQLMGHSDKRIPTKPAFVHWLSHLPSTSAISAV